MHIATFNPSTNSAQKPELTFEIIFLNSVSLEILFCGIRLLYNNFSNFNFFYIFFFFVELSIILFEFSFIFIEFFNKIGFKIKSFKSVLFIIPSI